jgi:ribosome-binding factor A
MDRMIKINELIKDQLGRIIIEELELPPESLVTVLRVKTSKDLNYGQAAVSILPDEEAEKILRQLNNCAKIIQKALNEKIVLRRIPRLTFVLDSSARQASEIDQLLDKIKAEVTGDK